MNRYLVAMGVVVLFIVLITVTITFNTFFIYVPPGKMLIITAKGGEELPAGEVLAKPGQKGILEDVYGEGLHFVMPVVYETEIAPMIHIPPGKIGVVVSRVGKNPPPGSIVVADDEKGIRRRVLTPGSYRLNPHGYQVEVHDAIGIAPGFVGFVTSLVGSEPSLIERGVGSAATVVFARPGEKGVLRNVLQPGIYYLNPREYRVQEVEIGINQVSFLGDTGIRFPSKDAFNIEIEATVEWELLPEHVAQVMVEFGNKQAIEDKVIVPQSKSIGRIQGSNYGAKEFLLGIEREKFQHTFTQQLEYICEAKNVTIHSAFIRHLSIPDNLLLPIRESFIAVEKEKTAKVWEETKKSASELERERALILQRRKEVQAQTAALVNTIQAEADQEVGKIDAEIRLEIAQVQQEIASIEASKTVLLGEANATVVRLKGEAQSKGIEAKIGAFGENPRAFVNYSFAQKIPENLQLKLIYSGAGTLWTDLGGTAGLGDGHGDATTGGGGKPTLPTLKMMKDLSEGAAEPTQP